MVIDSGDLILVFQGEPTPPSQTVEVVAEALKEVSAAGNHICIQIKTCEEFLENKHLKSKTCYCLTYGLTMCNPGMFSPLKVKYPASI